MNEITAFDMSRYQRIIDTANTRVRGAFVVHGEADRDIWITAHNVVIYDEDRSWGLGYVGRDLEAKVSGGEVTVYWDRMDDRHRAHAEEIKSEVETVVGLVALAFTNGYRAEVSESGIKKPGIDPAGIAHAVLA